MKYIILAILVFIFYRMVVKPKELDPPQKKDYIQESDEEGFVDYEEIE